MTPEQWKRITAIFGDALQYHADKRTAFLDAVCSGNAELRRQVEALLASDQDGDDFMAPANQLLAMPIPGSTESPAGSSTSVQFPDVMIGLRAGAYEVLDRIGSGGMGSVYLAGRTDGQFRKRVAIKFVQPGFGIPDSLRRFRNERQVLADLEHPNIARLLDGGVTDQGIPYLVMEYVEGVSIDRWCDARRLSVPGRLRLFRSVCAAVQYAHEKQVIHLDIKPSNILVTSEGIPKLLDFGIAKALDPDICSATLQTRSGMRPMTPAYASPEQLRGESVGPPSDIYSLGVVLYLLLTGRLPGEVRSNQHGEIVGTEQSIVRPSIAIGSVIRNGADQTTPEVVSAARSETPAGLRRRLSGDLDNVVLKALRTEPGRRYLSVGEFSDDLGRVLESRPVHARKETWLYRGHRFLKRNRPAAILTSVLTLLLAGLLGLERYDSSGGNSAQPKSLAVLKIQNRTEDAHLDWVDGAFRELLIADLSSAESIPVVSSDRIRDLISRRVKEESRFLPKQSRDVAAEALADLFLSGTLTKRSGRLRLEVRIEETATGRVEFSGTADGQDENAAPAMAAKISGDILARLAPHSLTIKPTVSPSLTDNVEALKAYDEGLRETALFHARQTHAAFQRAIDLDPQFVMAYYHLADWMRFSGNIPEGRRIIARAVQIAEHHPVPRLQKLLLQALQLRLDFRLDEAAVILEAAHREFAREIEPLYELAIIRGAEGQFPEAARLLEEAVRLDNRHALSHDQLGYFYAFQGDLTRSIESIDRYAALLRPGDVAPSCSRADVFLINERYEDAVAQYKRINYRPQAAIAAAFAGDYAPGDSMVETQWRNGNMRYEVAASLAEARGQLVRAAAFYAEAAEGYRASGLLREWFVLLKLTRIFLEQRQPDAVLALGQKSNSPWAPGFRGLAYLLLHQDASAEVEFDTLRDVIAPMLGPYIADKAVEFHRMQAASYAGHFDQVIQMWPRLPRSFWSLYALDVGRAYLRCSMYSEAEHHLQLAIRAQLALFWNHDMVAQHSLLTWMLAQFYMGQVFAKTSRQGRANATYEAFLKHLEGSPASLPQITEAERSVLRLPRAENGKLLFSDEFSGTAAEPGWSLGGTGRWDVGEGLLKASVQGREAAQCVHALQFHNAVFELRFRRDGVVSLVTRSESGGACGVRIGPGVTRLGVPKRGDVADLVAEVETTAAPGTWHTLRIEIYGKHVTARLDGQLILTGEHPGFDVDKTAFGLRVARGDAAFDYIRVFEVRPR